MTENKKYKSKDISINVLPSPTKVETRGHLMKLVSDIFRIDKRRWNLTQ